MTVICNYCGKPTEFVDSSVVYGRSYGMIYYCSCCRAWVGVHKGTDKPLGRLADAELRTERQKAHAVFDRLWKNRYKTRHSAYEWLAQQMGLTKDETHIGMFNVEQCRAVVSICNQHFAQMGLERP